MALPAKLKKVMKLIDYADSSSARVHFYVDGSEKESVTNDELQNKLLESYCKNIRYDTAESGCGRHTGFDVSAE